MGATLLGVATLYLILIGMVAFTLLLSAKTKIFCSCFSAYCTCHNVTDVFRRQRNKRYLEQDSCIIAIQRNTNCIFLTNFLAILTIRLAK